MTTICACIITSKIRDYYRFIKKHGMYICDRFNLKSRIKMLLNRDSLDIDLYPLQLLGYCSKY